MQNKFFFLAILITLSFSCNSRNSGNKTQAIKTAKWESVGNLVGNWIELERDSLGYFLYQPCDGQTPGLRITIDSIILKHQVEMPSELRIEEYTLRGDSISFNILSEEVIREYTFKVTPNENLVLFKWHYPQYHNRGKRIIAREEYARGLRYLEDPCDTDKRPNFQFLPVEFD